MEHLQQQHHRMRTENSFASPGTMTVPAVAYFWDIENCRVPMGKSPVLIAKLIRARFGFGRKESDFICVCDTYKEARDCVSALDNSQITIVHCQSVAKNAADDKLRSQMRKYAEHRGPGDVIVLISGDINFASELYEFKHKIHMRVIVLHPHQINDALLAFADENYLWDALMDEVPSQTRITDLNNPVNKVVVVSNLPREVSDQDLRGRLREHVVNTGGKVPHHRQHGAFFIDFPNVDTTRRARVRLDGTVLYPNHPPIKADFHRNSELMFEQLHINRLPAASMQRFPFPEICHPEHPLLHPVTLTPTDTWRSISEMSQPKVEQPNRHPEINHKSDQVTSKGPTDDYLPRICKLADPPRSGMAEVVPGTKPKMISLASLKKQLNDAAPAYRHEMQEPINLSFVQPFVVRQPAGNVTEEIETDHGVNCSSDCSSDISESYDTVDPDSGQSENSTVSDKAPEGPSPEGENKTM